MEGGSHDQYRWCGVLVPGSSAWPPRVFLVSRFFEKQMNKPTLVAILAVLVSHSAFSAIPAAAVRKALSAIPAVTGETVWERIRSCGITFSDGSWIERAIQDQPSIGARAGDLILDVYINVPRLPGDHNIEAYRDLLARWVIHAGRAAPKSRWADTLQNKAPPIGSDAWLNC